jgi:hypothetical protein
MRFSRSEVERLLSRAYSPISARLLKKLQDGLLAQKKSKGTVPRRERRAANEPRDRKSPPRDAFGKAK